MNIEFWIIVTAIATSVAALGSFFAAFTALYIASRQRKIYITVRADIAQVITATTSYELLSIDITNYGTRPATLTGLRIRTGIIKRKYFVLIHLTSNIIDFPKRLNDGETLEVQLPYPDFQDTLPNLISLNKRRFSWLGRKFIRFVAMSSSREEFSGKVGKILKQRLAIEYRKWRKGN